MRRRTLIAALAVAGALVVGGAALAGTTPPPAQSPACEQALQRLKALETRAAELAAKIAALEGQLASGDLSAKQETKARHRLAKVQKRLGKVEKRIDKAEAWAEARCAEEPTDPPEERPSRID